MQETVEIYIGDSALPAAEKDIRDPAAEGFLDVAADKLKSMSGRIASLFTSMRPDPNLFKGGAEEFELEIGFSIEVGPGGALKLILSPKVGMGCKAKMKWKGE